MEFYIHPS